MTTLLVGILPLTSVGDEVCVTLVSERMCGDVGIVLVEASGGVSEREFAGTVNLIVSVCDGQTGGEVEGELVFLRDSVRLVSLVLMLISVLALISVLVLISVLALISVLVLIWVLVLIVLRVSLVDVVKYFWEDDRWTEERVVRGVGRRFIATVNTL